MSEELISEKCMEEERYKDVIKECLELLAIGETRLANKYLCELIGLEENYFGFFD